MSRGPASEEGRIALFKEAILNFQSSNPYCQRKGVNNYSLLVSCWPKNTSKTKLKVVEKCVTEEEKSEFQAFTHLIAVIRQNQDEETKSSAIQVLRDIAFTPSSHQAILGSGIVPEIVETMMKFNDDTMRRRCAFLLSSLSNSSSANNEEGFVFPFESTIEPILAKFTEIICCAPELIAGDWILPGVFVNYLKHSEDLNRTHIQRLIEISFEILKFGYLPSATSTGYKNADSGLENSAIDIICAICERGSEERKRALCYRLSSEEMNKRTDDSWRKPQEKIGDEFLLKHVIAKASRIEMRTQVFEFFSELENDELKELFSSLSTITQKQLFSHSFLKDDSFKLQKTALQLMKRLFPLTRGRAAEWFALLEKLSEFLRVDKENMRITKRKITKNEDESSNSKIKANFEMRKELIDTFWIVYHSRKYPLSNLLSYSPVFIHLLSLKKEIPEVYSSTILYLEKILPANENSPPNNDNNNSIEPPQKKRRITDQESFVVNFFENLFSGDEILEKQALNEFEDFGECFSSEEGNYFLADCLLFSIIPQFIIISKNENKTVEFRTSILQKLSQFLLKPTFGLRNTGRHDSMSVVTTLFRRIINSDHEILQKHSEKEQIVEKCLGIYEMIMNSPEERFCWVKEFENWKKPIEGFFKQEIFRKPSNPNLILKLSKFVFICAVAIEKKLNTHSGKEEEYFKFRALDYENLESRRAMFPLFFEILLNSSNDATLRDCLKAVEMMLYYARHKDWFDEFFTETVKKRYQELAQSQDPTIQETAKKRLERW